MRVASFNLDDYLLLYATITKPVEAASDHAAIYADITF